MLAQHINNLLDSKVVEDVSIVSDNHKTAAAPRSPVCSSTTGHSQHNSNNNNYNNANDDTTEREEDDVVTELFSLRATLVGMSFNIVSDNPRSHVRPEAMKKPKSNTSRMIHSSSAPALQRWEGGNSSSPSSSPNKSSIQSIGLGTHNMMMMKMPTRSPRSSAEPQESSSQNTNANASWDIKPSSSSIPQKKISFGGAHVVTTMDKKRLQSLGLGGFASSAGTRNKHPSAAMSSSSNSPCRWSIPKRGSDSALIYPRRQRDF